MKKISKLIFSTIAIFLSISPTPVAAAITWVYGNGSFGTSVRNGTYQSTHPGLEHVSWTGSNPSQKVFTSFQLNPSGQNVGIVVYAPDEYFAPENATKEYPTIYFIHGINGHEWNHYGVKSYSNLSLPYSPVSLIKNHASDASIDPAIMVFINAGSYTGCDNTVVNSENMIIQELIPWVDANYRTIETKQGRAIQGFSMGGMCALYLGSKYDNMFSSVSTNSSACYLLSEPNQCDNIKSSVISNLTEKSQAGTLTTKFKVMYGSSETAVIKNMQDDVYNLLSPLGLAERNIVTGAGHNLQDQQASTNYTGSAGDTLGRSTMVFHMANFTSSPATPSPTPTDSLPTPTPTEPVASPTPTDSLTPNTPTPTFKIGDLNQDGTINTLDLDTLISNFGRTGSAGFISSDLQSDGVINVFDFNILVSNI